MLVSPVVPPNTNKKAPKTFIINALEAFYCCRGSKLDTAKRLSAHIKANWGKKLLSVA